MKKPARYLILLFVLSVSFILVPAAQAHPLGNFTINHYAGLEISRQNIGVDYILDMAEIAAFLEIEAMDANGDGLSDPAEMDRVRSSLCETIRSGLELRADGENLPLTLATSSLELPPGQGGLLTLRLSCRFEAPLHEGKEGETTIEFQSSSYAERLGWREIVVSGSGVRLSGDFSKSSLSNRLQSYPQDMLSNPLDQRKVTVIFAKSGGPVLQEEGRAPVEQVSGLSSLKRNDRFTELITQGALTPLGLLAALLISVVWGAAHALTPGHGKTIVGAYLVGSRGTAKHALYLGLTTTITHTFGVFILGLLTLFASRYILTERLFPWLTFLSGLMVVFIGLSLFLSRIRSARGGGGRAHHSHSYPNGLEGERAHDERAHHTHSHAHDHEHGHDHSHESGPGHLHSHAAEEEADHHHDHEHAHERAHRERAHDHHHHGHSHLPPGADGSPVTWRSLLALGISGGLIPCPSALVVLLGAIAVDRIAFGLVLVFAFSLGLAGVLTGIGVVFVISRRLFDRPTLRGGWLRLLPAASALFIALAGAGITAKAFIEIFL